MREILTPILVAALLVMVLSGCVATPKRFPLGDYAMSIASTDTASKAQAAAASRALANVRLAGMPQRPIASAVMI